jgi:hypothetical protein
VPRAKGTHAYHPDMEIAEQKGILYLLVLAIKWALFSVFDFCASRNIKRKNNFFFFLENISSFMT